MQALLQGPRQNFKLPVADFKQAVLDAQNGVNYPGKASTGLKIRLPIGKIGLAGPSSKKSKAAPRNKSAGSARLVSLCTQLACIPACLPGLCKERPVKLDTFVNEPALLSAGHIPLSTQHVNHPDLFLSL